MPAFKITRKEIVAYYIMAEDIVDATDKAKEFYPGFQSVEPVSEEEGKNEG